jgi:hypothetical protein
MSTQISRLIDYDEPWTRYRTLVDILDYTPYSTKVSAARGEIIRHPQIQALITRASSFGDLPIKRHNDAGHPLYALSTLADFGCTSIDPGIGQLVEMIFSHQSPEGAFQSLVNVAKSFGGSGEDEWSWMACDAPTLLYVLLSFGLGDDQRVRRAVEHLIYLVTENGYRCCVAPELGRFRGPGRKSDPCPIANVFALKAFSMLPESGNGSIKDAGQVVNQVVEMLLSHWEKRKEVKYYLFGIGSDFQKLKYPYVWYDILHVGEVLSRFEYVFADTRFQEMVAAITDQADNEGRYRAGSMYQSWKGWSFADKKNSSPWLTFLVLRILKRQKKYQQG